MIDSRCSDSQLVALYQTGNEEAFAMLLQRHKSRIYTAIYLIVKDRYVAEDLLQETFIKVVNTIKSGRYNEEGKFLPWLSRVAHNLAIDHFRRKKRYPEIVLEDGSRVFNSLDFAEDSYESAQMFKETKSRLRDLIKELPGEQKQVLIMRHYLQMSFQEIAERTGVSINTALGRMRYALINLRKKMVKNHIAYDKNFYPKRSDQVFIPRDFGDGDEGDS
jgi:RNA polymerase sigma factor (sigma-70 family)